MLSGGGARGAYEVGVLRYVREQLPCPTPFRVITGSSVGAINGSYIAATCERPRAQARTLARVWNEIRLDEVYRFGWEQMRLLPTVLFGKDLPKLTHGATIGGLVDSQLMQQVVRKRIPWSGITNNLHAGNLDAFACSATELATGVTTVFVQTRGGAVGDWPKLPGQMIVPTAITAAHTLASAAIPVLFPAVRVGDQFYVDGSLRQNTPIRPAMHLGADRLLVVGLRHDKETQHLQAKAREEARMVYPNAVFMLGKMLNALLLDKLEADLARIERTNQLIRAGTEIYGPDFAEKIAEGISGRKGRPYRQIELVLIQPSRDLGELAWEIMQRTRLKNYSGVMARWLRRATEGTDDVTESDLASYVLFDPEYVAALIDLGYKDAAAKHDELMTLWAPSRTSENSHGR
ncbi:MAG: patatin-like phospholipase family protein [Myxococcota bacterium]